VSSTPANASWRASSRGRQAHRKLGEFPLQARSGPAELPLKHTPQQIFIEHHPAFPDIIQVGGQRRGIADFQAAVPDGHRHRLRRPVPLRSPIASANCFAAASMRPAPPEQQVARGNVGIGLLDVATGTHLSTLATRARAAMEQARSAQSAAGDMHAVHSHVHGSRGGSAAMDVACSDG
jgi:hypothetical protein